MKKTTLFLALTLLLSSATNFAQIAINNDGSAPDASAMLDVQSTTKGLLLPRLTGYAISSPAAGLVIYNTQAETIQFFNGNTWENLTEGNCGDPYYDTVNTKYYETTLIGDQCWMAENLTSIKYNDGTNIPLVTDNTAWETLTTPGYCWYNNDSTTYGIAYGALYNWHSVDTGILCPSGWHIPTDVEWTILENYLIANGYNYDGTTTGNNIAKSMASGFNWNSSSDTGVTGNTDYTAYRNKSGFRALPGGNRDNNGVYDNLGILGIWGSSTQYNNNNSWTREIFYNYSYVQKNNNHKEYGFSVRCLRD